MAAIQLRPERVRALRLAAQHLTDASVAETLVDAAAVCGLQDTPPGSAALGLAARASGVMPDDVARALVDDRSLVIVWSRRGSPYLVPSADLGVFTRGLLPDDEESWRAAVQGFVGHLETVEMTASELVSLVDEAVFEVLADRELTKRELGEALAPLMPPALRKWFDADTFSSFTAVLTRAASLFGRFVIAPREGSDLTFVRTDRWLGSLPQDEPEAARHEMTRRYVHAYGPTSPRAYADWAGIGEGHARRAFEALADELVAVRVEGADGRVLAGDAAVLDEVAAPLGVRLLPPHDAYLASPDRRVIVPEANRHKALWKAAGNPGAVLVDGEIAGSWRPRKSGRKLELEVFQFRTLPVSAKSKVEIAAARLGAFKGAQVTSVEFTQ